MFVFVLPLLWQHRTRTVVFEVVVNWVRTPRKLIMLKYRFQNIKK